MAACLSSAARALARRAPELDARHMESLALAIGSTLDGLPAAFFDDVAALARSMGPARLAEFHADQAE